MFYDKRTPLGTSRLKWEQVGPALELLAEVRLGLALRLWGPLCCSPLQPRAQNVVLLQPCRSHLVMACVLPFPQGKQSPLSPQAHATDGWAPAPHPHCRARWLFVPCVTPDYLRAGPARDLCCPVSEPQLLQWGLNPRHACLSLGALTRYHRDFPYILWLLLWCR